ncbi:MAG: hypothetical protein JO265_00180 [Acidimicrobiia bacterium]|nr:hypothetical protein [Acidimicrobiia bacterium]
MIPSVLRSRMALIALLGAFLIPILLSSLQGLTHVLTCQQATNVPFTVQLPAHGPPTISSSDVITRQQGNGLCGGLRLDMRVGQESSSKVRIILPIANNTKDDWQGSVKLQLGSATVPVRIGSIPAGQTRQDVIHFRVDPGTHDINGSLLIGP